MLHAMRHIICTTVEEAVPEISVQTSLPKSLYPSFKHCGRFVSARVCMRSSSCSCALFRLFVQNQP